MKSLKEKPTTQERVKLTKIFSDSDINHLNWLRNKAFQARERLELAEEMNRGPQSEALLDLIDSLGDACVRTIWGIVQQKCNVKEKTLMCREIKAMSRDIIDVAWEVDEAIEVITEFVLGEE